MVTKQDVKNTLKNLNLNSTDTVMVHSSLKSFGIVDGGADTVIDAFIEFFCQGTVIFPALRTMDFFNAYVNWDINNTPSDVGLISETFRKRKGVLRSDQETHSVCAIGKNAEFVTCGHRSGEMRYGVFGDYAFCSTSPYVRMRELNAKVVLIGVTLESNTFNHLIEHDIVNEVVKAIPYEEEREKAIEKIARYDDFSYMCQFGDWKGKIWPFFDANKAHSLAIEKGLLKSSKCGASTLYVLDCNEYYNFMHDRVLFSPSEWLNESNAQDSCKWLNEYSKYIKKDN